MKTKSILMSPADSKIYEFFERQFNVIPTDCLEDFISYEQYHADMQALKIKETLFINSNCKNLISSLNQANISFISRENIGCRYPLNVALNALPVGDKLFCLEKALHPLVKEYCLKNGIEIINVKQGYTKCSTLKIDEYSIITDDENIYRTALKAGLDTLLIEKGDIYLDENNYGFIGGASATIGDSIYFFGDINKHRNADKIKEFIEKKNKTIECVNCDFLMDIGGIITLD